MAVCDLKCQLLPEQFMVGATVQGEAFSQSIHDQAFI